MKKNQAYLLDMDIVIYWLKNQYPKINTAIKKIPEEYLFISSITLAELYFGAFNSSKREENKHLIDEFLETVNIVHFDESSARCFGEIKSLLKNQGKIINDSDLFIAATAISNDLILVTNNEKHFKRIDQLGIENWVY